MDVQSLEQVLRSRQHDFLQPSPDLHAAVIQLAKSFLDPLATDLTNLQTRRLQFQRQNKKRKRGAAGVDGNTNDDLLRMKKVHVEGFDVDQVWQQAKRVLNAAAVEVERQVPDEDNEESEGGLAEGETLEGEEEFDEDGFKIDASGEEDLAMEAEGDESDEGEDMEDINDEEASDGEGLQDGQETPPSDLSEDDEQEAETLVKDKHGLNDGFFSIDDFNKKTQFLEDIDAKGDANDGAASDEEDVDWYADPMTMDIQPALSQRRKEPKSAMNDEDEGSDADGPTFGNVDINAPEGDSEDEDMDDVPEDDYGMGEISNTNNVQYKDFFEPPARQASKRKNKPKGPRPTDPLATENDYEGDMERTMQAVHRDLFDDDLSEEEADAAVTAERKNLSSHEASQLTLREEIRRLEAANVAPKNWSLTGETVAPRRPLNSLLEEDLDFERAGKPVPVITADINESIEQLIKRRIVAKEFDEVVRRRPDDLLTGTDPRRGRLRDELSDAKPVKGLAEEYEQDHLRRTDANYVDTRTEVLKKTHKDIEAQWVSISAQLDSLSNWHYKPKPAAPSLDIRVDAPTISMEDARPSAGGEVGGASTLAPQEIYRPGDEGRRADEVLTKGGTVVAKDEETREQKRRRRSRAKERAKKAGGGTNGAAASGGAAAAVSTTTGAPAKKGSRAEKAEVLGQLKKGGVKVIGKGGALTKVDGTIALQDGDRRSAGVYKL